MYEMKEKTTYEKIKSGIKGLATLYVIAGSCYMLAQPVTGHHSTDLHECLVEPSALEIKLCDKLGVDISQPQCDEERREK